MKEVKSMYQKYWKEFQLFVFRGMVDQGIVHFEIAMVAKIKTNAYTTEYREEHTILKLYEEAKDTE